MKCGYMIMKHYFILLLSCLLACHLIVAAERWAIIVGIGSYPEDSGWKSIHGDNDIELVVPMLLRNQFQQQHISILINEQATKCNIENAVNALITHLRSGDIVYFHFSGHGQLVTDISGDEGDYGYDESLVPYDAKSKYEFNGYKGENHIIDDELNQWLMTIKKRIGCSGKILVVLDACHSGGGSRDENDDEKPLRGTRDCFNIPKTEQSVRSEQNPIKWICISACKSAQSNYEYKDDRSGRIYGRLSYALSKILTPGETVEQFEKQLILQYDNMSALYPQKPMIEYDLTEVTIL